MDEQKILDGLSLYRQELEWLAGRGLLDDHGLYPFIGADAMPLLYSHGPENILTGISLSGEDALYMARLIEIADGDPAGVFGRFLSHTDYLGVETYRWHNYTHIVANLHSQNPLPDRKFDWVMLKGAKLWSAYDDKRYKKFMKYISAHTKRGGTVLLSSARRGLEIPIMDSQGAPFLEEMGYEDLTGTDDYTDATIAGIRGSYASAEEITAIEISGPPRTNIMGRNDGILQASGMKLRVIEPAGNFRILRKP